MSKTPTKTEPTNKPNGVESMVGIAKIVLNYRGKEKPNLAEIGRIVGRASSLLRISSLDERFELENRAAVQVAKETRLDGLIRLRRSISTPGPQSVAVALTPCPGG
jgi:hypothetical protein